VEVRFSYRGDRVTAVIAVIAVIVVVVVCAVSAFLATNGALEQDRSGTPRLR